MRIVKFPASASKEPLAAAVNVGPVRVIDKSSDLNEKLGGIHHRFRLSIDPWDLVRVIREANRLGREGRVVDGFGYDYDTEAIHIGEKRAGQA